MRAKKILRPCQGGKKYLKIMHFDQKWKTKYFNYSPFSVTSNTRGHKKKKKKKKLTAILTWK